ncbi:MAG: hypothetical protein ABEH43_02830, partial [Flavobacteriales bacterium]
MPPDVVDSVENMISKGFESFNNENKGGSNSMSSLGMKIDFTPIIKEEEEDKDVGLIQAVAGTSIMMLLFSVTGMGGSLLDEKE